MYVSLRCKWIDHISVLALKKKNSEKSSLFSEEKNENNISEVKTENFNILDAIVQSCDYFYQCLQFLWIFPGRIVEMGVTTNYLNKLGQKKGDISPSVRKLFKDPHHLTTPKTGDAGSCRCFHHIQGEMQAVRKINNKEAL